MGTLTRKMHSECKARENNVGVPTEVWERVTATERGKIGNLRTKSMQ